MHALQYIYNFWIYNVDDKIGRLSHIMCIYIIMYLQLHNLSNVTRIRVYLLM